MVGSGALKNSSQVSRRVLVLAKRFKRECALASFTRMSHHRIPTSKSAVDYQEFPEGRERMVP